MPLDIQAAFAQTLTSRADKQLTLQESIQRRVNFVRSDLECIKEGDLERFTAKTRHKPTIKSLNLW